MKLRGKMSKGKKKKRRTVGTCVIKSVNCRTRKRERGQKIRAEDCARGIKRKVGGG